MTEPERLKTKFKGGPYNRQRVQIPRTLAVDRRPLVVRREGAYVYTLTHEGGVLQWYPTTYGDDRYKEMWSKPSWARGMEFDPSRSECVHVTDTAKAWHEFYGSEQVNEVNDLQKGPTYES